MNNQPNYELLREAYAIIGGIPPRQFHLDSLVKERGPSPSCGTIACAAGWLGMHPKFQALGLGVREDRLTWNGEYEYFWKPISRVFGITEQDAQDLFGSVGDSCYDGDIPKYLTHKARWKARVKIFLRERGQLTAQLKKAGKL